MRLLNFYKSNLFSDIVNISKALQLIQSNDRACLMLLFCCCLKLGTSIKVHYYFISCEASCCIALGNLLVSTVINTEKINIRQLIGCDLHMKLPSRGNSKLRRQVDEWHVVVVPRIALNFSSTLQQFLIFYDRLVLVLI